MKYEVWKDHATGEYQIMTWDELRPSSINAVQINIRTYEKAREACWIWQQRERERKAS